MVVQDSNENVPFEPEPPPRLRRFGCFATFLLLAQPPLLARRGDGPVRGVPDPELRVTERRNALSRECTWILKPISIGL